MSDHPGIAAENASVYGYGVVVAHADPSFVAAARRQLAAHRARRDAALGIWSDAPAPPVGYGAPPLSGTEDALRLAARLEADCCAAWRTQITAERDPAGRRFCVDALTAAAVQLARWRAPGPDSAPEAFPGFPADF